MKVFLDFEFIEDGKTIDPISVGLIREDGATYYAETKTSAYLVDSLPTESTLWLHNNVVPYLDPLQYLTSTGNLKENIIKFVGFKPEFWAYYADYDWVALCQLYGRMIDLPKGWPMYCRDLKQEADRQKVNLSEVVPFEGRKHHALDDAKWELNCAKHLGLVA